MIPKVQEKELVIALRKKGLTYREILRQVPVSKSSISTWLKDVPLSNTEKKILSERKNEDISRWRLRAAASQRKARDLRIKELHGEARIEFLKFIEDPFFQVGVALYWAEGAKRTTTFSFINSDLDMINIMLGWIVKFLAPPEAIRLRVFTHKAFSGEGHEKFWSDGTGIPLSSFGKTVYKTHDGLIIKKRPNYKGCLRIELGKVRYLRKMLFWQQMLIEYYGKAG